MPNITAAGTYTKDDAGFEGLASKPGITIIRAAATTFSGSITVQYIDDAGNPQTYESGTKTALPWTFRIEGSENRTNLDNQIVVTGTFTGLNITVT